MLNCIRSLVRLPLRSHKLSRRSATAHSRGTKRRTRVTFNERHAGAPNHTTLVRAMRVLMSFSLLGGTIRRTHNTHELYAATVKPGRISRRRNLNSWNREEEETGERASNGENEGRGEGEERRNGEGERIGMRGEKEETALGSFVRWWLYEDNADKS